MNNPLYKTFSTDELDANYGTVSLNKCGICLCRQGWADVLMNNHRYHIEKNGLCLYTPYTFIRILQHSDEFDGYLMEADLEVLSAALENIPVMNRSCFRNKADASNKCWKYWTYATKKCCKPLLSGRENCYGWQYKI